MPSLVDIPSHLLSIDQKDAFLAWLKQLPIQVWMKRDLARAWMYHVKQVLFKDDYWKAGL
jgi:hypothetical protein